MTESDLTSVSAIEQSSTPHPWKPAHFAESLKTNYTCVVVEQNNCVIGHAITMMVAGEAQLLIITIEKGHQGKGVGKKLLHHLYDLAIEKKCSTFLLEVRQSNEKALNLYMNEGFSEIGIRRNYYPAGKKREDAIVMALDLDLLGI